MPRVSKKAPQQLIELYRIALIKGARIESWKENDCTHIWTRQDDDKEYEQLWIILKPDGTIEVVESRDKSLGWNLRETIGTGIINPRAVAII